MNADAVQTEGKGTNENIIKNANPQTQSVKTVRPEEIPTGGIGKWEPLNGIEEEGVAARIQKCKN